MTTALKDYTGFTSIDATGDPELFVRFLDTVSELDGFVSLKARLDRRLALSSGETVLDVGCGTGADVRRFAGRVAPGGRVTGIDASAGMVNVARRRAAEAGLAGAVEVLVGDATDLVFPDASFDAVTADRVLMHTADPHRAVADLIRVLRPGGRLVTFDIDLDATLAAGPHFELAARAVAVASRGYRSGRVARDLPGLFAAAGLDVDVAPHGLVMPYQLFADLMAGPLHQARDAGFVEEAEIEAWDASLAEAHQEGRFLGVFNGLLLTARKPAETEGRPPTL